MNRTLKLGDNFYVKDSQTKTQILLLDTNMGKMKHFYEWLKKGENKGYKKTTPFTISKDGKIYKHYDPKNTSSIFNDLSIDQNIIPISIENESNLIHSKEKGFINNLGYIYRQDVDSIVEKQWRGGLFWTPYNDIQMESIAKLVKDLLIEFDIENNVVKDNTFLVEPIKFCGVLSKSNYSRLTQDINPSFDFNKLKKLIDDN